MKRLRFFARFAIAAAGIFALAQFAPQAAYAQTITSGTIAGTVVDPSGGLVSGAKVTATDQRGISSTLTTSGAGDFKFASLTPGDVVLKASAAGFQETTIKAAVALGQVVPVTIQLSVQAQKETVLVTETMPLTQSENSNLVKTYDSLQIDNLPDPGGDMTAYAQTVPGITLSTGAGYGNFIAFGLPGTSNLFTVNGSDNMDPYLNLNNSGASNLTLGSNEVSEVAVVVNAYSGQYGRMAGAQVNYVTKSGTNAFHGNAVFNYNGRVLNANDWFNNANGAPRPFAISRQWADSLGGPLKKNKLFAFYNNEGLRYVLPSGGPVYIPTADFANAVLANLGKTNPAAVPIYTKAFNLYAGSPGAGAAVNVPITADDPGGCGDIADPVFGVSKPCARKFQDSTNNLNTEQKLAFRVDLNATNNDRFYFRYDRDRGVQATGTDPINSVFNANSIQPTDIGQFGYTRSIGSHMVNQLLLSGSYYSAIFGPPNLSAALAAFPTTIGFADGDFAAVGGGDNVYPQGRNVGQWQVIDDFSIVKGRHDMKFGVNFRRNYVSTFAFGPGTSGLVTINSMTDFFNGSLANGSTYSQTFTKIGAEPLKMYSEGFYAQDQWALSSSLTMSLAVRFDRNSNITCKKNCFAEFGVPFGSIDHSATTPYNSSVKTGLAQAFPDQQAFVITPRIGLAWKSPNGKTVVRGGEGLFTDLYPGLVADNFLTNLPNVASFTATSGTIAPGVAGSAFANVSASAAALQNGFSSGATLAQLQASVPGFAKPNFNSVASSFKNPQYLEWNFEIQQAIGQTTSLSVNYVGNRGINELTYNLLGNAASSKNFAGLPATAPDSRFGQIRELTNQGHSNYNGLVNTFNWRSKKGFSGSIGYTWSHALDTCSNGCLTRFNLLSAVSIRSQIAPGGGLSYGNADYDTRHALNGNYLYVTPKMKKGFVDGLLGHWTLAGTVLYHSGYPYSIVTTTVRSTQSIVNASGLITIPVLADYVSGPTSCTTPNVQCYKTSGFLTAANQHNFGNLSRNSFRGPGYFDTDFNVRKGFSLSERYVLEIGANFYNVLNHANFDNPVNNISVGNFGAINETVSAPSSPYGSFQGSAVSGRTVQMVVKFKF